MPHRWRVGRRQLRSAQRFLGCRRQEAKVNKPLSFLQFPAIVDPFGRVDALRVVRCIGFIATVLILWVSLRPFPDLGDPTIGAGEKGKLATTAIRLGMLSLVVLLLTSFRHAMALRTL